MINSKATNITIIAPTNYRLLYAKIRTFPYACLACIGTYIAQWVDPMGLSVTCKRKKIRLRCSSIVQQSLAAKSHKQNKVS